MVIGQTMFSVRPGTEHRAQRALEQLAGYLQGAPGHAGHRVLRSFGMSPLGSALCDEGREASLGDVHFVFQTEWESLLFHDEFFQSPPVQHIYDSLQSILESGPFEVLYDAIVEAPAPDGAAV